MKRLTLLLFATLILWADEPFTIDKAQVRAFGTTLRVNAKVVQLNNRTQRIVSRLGGHLEAYHVKVGQKVHKGQKIATLKSLKLSRMSARYLALGQKIKAAQEKLATTRKLYEKGLASKEDLNKDQMQLASIKAQHETLATQLRSLGIDAATLKKATDTVVVRAHTSGTVSELLVALHTNIDPLTPLVTLSQSEGYFALAYLPVDVAMGLSKKIDAIFYFASRQYAVHFEYLLPKVDQETQRAQALFTIEQTHQTLLLDAFGELQLDLAPMKRYVAVKRSGLTLFKNEWVVFIPGSAHEEETHEAEEKGHDDHDSPAFIPQAVHIVTYFGDYAAVEGIEAGQPYVSEGVWFVKSLLLRGELGEHGH